MRQNTFYDAEHNWNIYYLKNGEARVRDVSSFMRNANDGLIQQILLSRVFEQC